MSQIFHHLKWTNSILQTDDMISIIRSYFTTSGVYRKGIRSNTQEHYGYGLIYLWGKHLSLLLDFNSLNSEKVSNPFYRHAASGPDSASSFKAQDFRTMKYILIFRWLLRRPSFRIDVRTRNRLEASRATLGVRLLT